MHFTNLTCCGGLWKRSDVSSRLSVRAWVVGILAGKRFCQSITALGAVCSRINIYCAATAVWLVVSTDAVNIGMAADSGRCCVGLRKNICIAGFIKEQIVRCAEVNMILQYIERILRIFAKSIPYGGIVRCIWHIAFVKVKRFICQNGYRHGQDKQPQ